MNLELEIVKMQPEDIAATAGVTSIAACMIPGQIVEECDTDEM